MEFRNFGDESDSRPWTKPKHSDRQLQPINLAPLKGALESDPVRSRILRVLIQDGGWVTTADLLRAARHERSIIGAVTIGTMLHGLNELVSSRLILSRTSLASGLDWAEWRIDPDWLEPTRRLLKMLTRSQIRRERNEPKTPRQRLLNSVDHKGLLKDE
ncbi:hypothetical protein EU538_08050 [Candidatus Thorarchaeota archaeon]|jgi:hypothetical protein|nr:MAG: hypothetical protein EU538_08050 [Candidatus Thorarchaeota archaeon]